MPDYQGDEIIKEFLHECNEHLDQLDKELIIIESNPTDKKILSSIFRSIHTIKGGAGILGFSKLETLAHSAENLLSMLRDGKLAVHADMITALLSTVDSIRHMLKSINENMNDGNETFSDMINLLTRFQQGITTPIVTQPAPPRKKKKQTQKQDDNIIEQDVHSQNQVVYGLADSTIRVDVSLLDRLMNLAGELVLARNNAMQLILVTENSDLRSSVLNISQITSELREGIMKMRMQAISSIWSKFPRVVRDISRICNKRVKLEVNGENTELDKSLLEAIRDPLTHLIRNAIDHGIEAPDVRIKKNKNPEGQLSLIAFHEGGHINIEISDDGAGIDYIKISEKALDKGLINADQKSKMTPQELMSLIFLPGLTATDTVTSVSGRGVGMDVVKTNIEKIGGTVSVYSKMDEGTCFKLKIPLTLAIIPALIINSNNSYFAIPQINIVELVRLDAHNHDAIEMYQNVPVYRLRGQLIQIIFLNNILSQQKNMTYSTGSEINMVISKVDGKLFGIVVDEIIDTQEIVVKPLSKQLKTIPIYAGATMMGTGKIAMILDIPNLAQVTNIISSLRERMLKENDDAKNLSLVNPRQQELLLVERQSGSKVVIPLSEVARLEVFASSAIEWTGDLPTMQYRAYIIPLVFISSIFSDEPTTKSSILNDHLHAVIYSKNKQTIGIIVDKILDIVDGEMQIQKTGCRRGFKGTMVINHHIAEVLDLDDVIDIALPNIFTDQHEST